MEIGLILRVVAVVAVWLYCYPKGYCDWCLPNRLKSKVHREH